VVIDNRNRGFHYAVVVSLALHALLLFAFPELLDTARRAASIPPQIIARLREPEPAPAPAVPVQPVRREAPAAKKDPKPAPVEAPPVAAPAVPPSPPIAAAEPQPAPSSSPPMVEAPESLSRDQYRVQLIDEARRHKRYPPLARENNWQGDVVVGVSIGTSGRTSVSLKASSGYEVLDRQALEMFRQAARAVPVPPALRGKDFTLDLRAVYALAD
jgi:periplasmic protein TonB